MSLAALLAAGALFRRLLCLRNLLLALLAGGAAGLVVRSLPTPGLAVDLLGVLVAGLVALLVLPLVAGQLTGDRACGYELLQGCRPIPSLSWAVGRLVGCFVAAAVLAWVVDGVARQVAAGRPVPRVLQGRALGDAGEWRFDLPAGVPGPYVLRVETFLALAGAGEVTVDLRRGEATRRLTLPVRVARHHELSLPDLAPERGGLYVVLTPGDGVVLGQAPPTLTAGSAPLGDAGPGLARRPELLARLGFALLAVLAAASAFHFETACLAGLVALGVPPRPDAPAWLAVLALQMAFCVLGTSLVRRSALP